MHDQHAYLLCPASPTSQKVILVDEGQALNFARWKPKLDSEHCVQVEKSGTRFVLEEAHSPYFDRPCSADRRT